MRRTLRAAEGKQGETEEGGERKRRSRLGGQACDCRCNDTDGRNLSTPAVAKVLVSIHSFPLKCFLIFTCFTWTWPSPSSISPPNP
jgi:hypothetical protein